MIGVAAQAQGTALNGYCLPCSVILRPSRSALCSNKASANALGNLPQTLKQQKVSESALLAPLRHHLWVQQSSLPPASSSLSWSSPAEADSGGLARPPEPKHSPKTVWGPCKAPAPGLCWGREQKGHNSGLRCQSPRHPSSPKAAVNPVSSPRMCQN